jgi:tetratricopeptide (TPR) repeat protein
VLIQLSSSKASPTDVQGTDQREFTGHYSSTALRSVKSFVPRLGLHAQIKERLHDTLENRGRSCKILVVCGLGGAGKSQLVLNYVEDFKDDYTATFWIDASLKERLEADYKQIHNLLLRPARDGTDIDTCVSEVKQWCQGRGPRRCLFVLDSADSIEDQDSAEHVDLWKFIVDVASADVVITTRVQSAKDMTDLEVVQVAELSSEESREIFIRRLGVSDPSLEMQREIDTVTEELGHFALAVSLAAAYVASTRRLKAHPAGYLVEYAQRKTTLLARRPKQHIDQYGESVLTTWEISYAAISSQCPEACNLLTFLAFLSSSTIFPELMHSRYGTASGILASVILVQNSTMSLQETLDRGFENLELYSLLQWNDQHVAFSMHKLVQTWAFERLESDEQVTFCFAAWNYLKHLCLITRDLPAMGWRLVSHVMACFVKVRALCHVGPLVAEDVVRLATSLANFLVLAGRLDFAYALQSFSHHYNEHELLVGPVAHAKSLCLLARILREQYKYDAAEQLLRQALDRLDGTPSGEHVRIRESCQRILARILMDRHESHSGAEQSEEMLRCLLDQQHQRNASDNDRIQTVVGLARALMRQERHEEAEKLYKQILERPEKLRSQFRHPITIDLSVALQHQGKYAEAEDVAQRASERALIHGATDSRSQWALMALGEVKLAQKAYASAAALFGQACDATATPNHPRHLKGQINLARALRHLPSYEKALVAYTRAVDGFARTLGDHHHLTQQYSTELLEVHQFLAGRESFKLESEHTSIRIGRALESGQAFAVRDCGFYAARGHRRSPSANLDVPPGGRTGWARRQRSRSATKSSHDRVCSGRM